MYACCVNHQHLLLFEGKEAAHCQTIRRVSQRLEATVLLSSTSRYRYTLCLVLHHMPVWDCCGTTWTVVFLFSCYSSPTHNEPQFKSLTSQTLRRETIGMTMIIEQTPPTAYMLSVPIHASFLLSCV